MWERKREERERRIEVTWGVREIDREQTEEKKSLQRERLDKV